MQISRERIAFPLVVQNYLCLYAIHHALSSKQQFNKMYYEFVENNRRIARARHSSCSRDIITITRHLDHMFVEKEIEKSRAEQRR